MECNHCHYAWNVFSPPQFPLSIIRSAKRIIAIVALATSVIYGHEARATSSINSIVYWSALVFADDLCDMGYGGGDYFMLSQPLIASLATE